LYRFGNSDTFLVADASQLKAWMVSRQFLLDLFAAGYEAASQSLMVVIVAAVVGFAWSIGIIFHFYFVLSVPPAETLMINRGKISELICVSLVLVMWVFHLFNTVVGISKSQARHADELEKAMLALQLEPENSEARELYTKQVEHLVEGMVKEIRSRDSYPRAQCITITPSLLGLLATYLITGLGSVVVTQLSSAQQALESLKTESSTGERQSPKSPGFAVGAVIGTVSVYAAAHFLHAYFSPDILIAEKSKLPLNEVAVKETDNPAADILAAVGGVDVGAQPRICAIELEARLEGKP
jgi:hypothetical protein